MGKYEYLIVLGACLVITLPLELIGARVYRRPSRLVRAVLPAAAVFLVWDIVAIAAGVWGYNPEFITGVILPFGVPLEELLFFLVIPICGLLTYEAVNTILELLRRWRATARERRPR
ncbi:lycopene cyclase domain-containing protein [Amycolatopsis nigrescens]|uniref:lycopene cyclase domain-containing protein n=1 Tax=Amycolatopsis nigrescens TaxID=381445 RepID=UPI00037D6EC8|nr:lycopene cyclase domain-containing protein [Amycolatopsis nigrescens]